MKNGQRQLSRSNQRRPVQCPKCSSYKAVLVNINLSDARYRCADCGKMYSIGVVGPITVNGNDNGHAPSGYAEQEFPAIETRYLRQLKVTHRARASAAMGWRSRFLKGLASSWGYMFALRSAGVSYNTFRSHERNDAEFAAQVREAEAQGAQLLHDVCWKRAMEGDLEPVYWQGKIVDHVRKFDTRLQIEFLRAYKPERFKRPGTQVNVGTKGSIFILTEEERHELQRINREWLEENSPKKKMERAQVLPDEFGQ